MSEEMKVLFSNEKDGSVKILFVGPVLLACGQALGMDFTGWTNLDYHYQPSPPAIDRGQHASGDRIDGTRR